ASAIHINFSEGFREMSNLYNANKLEECLAKGHELLESPAIPRYHRMKTLTLLSATTGDWYEADAYRMEAESLWRTTRLWNPEGRDGIMDKFLAQVREELDVLQSSLQEQEQEMLDEDMEDEEAAMTDSEAMEDEDE
ncbi:hypothetical protein P153DRAFT_267656, partial [Dothidotthia symphoricarpi CBS 119687]